MNSIFQILAALFLESRAFHDM